MKRITWQSVHFLLSSGAMVGIFFILSGCGSRDFKNSNYSQAVNFTHPPTYSTISTQILIPKCASCHSGSGGENSLNTYAGVHREVHAGDSKNSRLYKEVVNGNMPMLAPSLTDDEVLAISEWIDNGALND